MLPFEFIIDGPPMSAQSRNRKKLAEWKARIRTAAEARWRDAPFPRNVRVVVTYYHEHRFALLDTDNMVKPILDALTGLVYFDDRRCAASTWKREFRVWRSGVTFWNDWKTYPSF